jgi:hypothetical protein
MKIAILLLAGATLAALDVRPEPGLDVSGDIGRPDPGLALHGTWFHDLRLLGGVSSPVQYAEVGNLTVRSATDYGNRFAVQYVLGRAGREVGWGIGLEVAYDDHVGEVDRINGAQTGHDGIYTRLESVSLGVLPKLIVRPTSADVIDWGPGSVQLEIGPYGAAGLGRGYIGGTRQSDDVQVLTWGVRGDFVLTSARGWQFGVSAAYEYFTATPSWDGVDGRMRGHGPTLALVLGHRL